MLRLYLSKDRKENSRRMYASVCAAAQQGQGGQLLIVPEQFSHSAELRLCAEGGATISRYAEVLGFSRLAMRVFACEGGIADTETDAAGRLLMMSLAVEQVRSRLKIYGVGANKPAFLLQLLQMLEELRSFCIRPENLREKSRFCEGVLGEKLEEFALLMESFDSVCANLGQSPESRLSRLLIALEGNDFPKGKHFYFDGFTDFNGIELEIIKELLLGGGEVSVYLHCDDLTDGEQQFAAARETGRKLLSLEKQAEVIAVASEEQDSPLQYLRSHLFGGGRGERSAEGMVQFIEGGDAMHECRITAGEILKLLEQGVRLRDITVACADYATYRPLLETVFHRADLPAYFAGDTDILRQSVVHMLLAALEAADGMEQEDVLSYLKSGFVPLSADACDRLENYILLWGLSGSRLEQSWTQNPFGMREVREERKRNCLEALNRDRESLMLPLSHLRDGLRRAANTGEMLLRLNDFLEEIQLNETLNAMAAELSSAGELQKAQEYAQVYEIICGLMEQMYGILGETVRSVEEFRLLFRTAVSLYTVGTIPASMDCISVGSLSSQRRNDTPYLFLLGANEGAFPTMQSNQSLLTDSERNLLMAQGLGVAPTTMQALDRELAMMDSVFSAPEKGLYIGTVKGREAYYARRARNLFPDGRCITSDEALVCRAPREYAIACGKSQPYQIPDLSDSAVTALYGKTLRLSSSKVDVLASCRFAYFLQYGLKAEERKTAQMDASLYGTFVHDVLEHTVPKVMEEGGFATVSVERVLEIAEEFMEAYTVEVLAPLWESERAEYLFRRSFSEVRTVVRRLYAELSVSQFEPKWFELSFGNRDADLPAVKIVGSHMEAELEGKVDRADIWQDGERCYVRVVDYKTGKKSFEYTKIYYGLGLQMLLYLFALRRMMPQQPYPAGVLYFPARMEQVSKQERLSEEELEKHSIDSHSCSGLLYRDERVLQAMEPGESPRFMPYRNDNRGKAQSYLADGEQLRVLEDFVFSKVAELGDELYSGRITPNPYEGKGEIGSACQWCPYSEVCGGKGEIRWLERLSPKEFWSAVEGGEVCG